MCVRESHVFWYHFIEDEVEDLRQGQCTGAQYQAHETTGFP